ncbi:hypothetical protein B296_00000621 [Ensete ventricosum]|uniref:Uncharacterized protein n=1 Tax=Ensete ventricosum TaxID=4639 RepID=A0A427AQX3_ENSVE|nr:hypothetical protein B296_00000621 [Ensete ventricosum]
MIIVEHGRRQRRQWRQRKERPTVDMTKEGVALWVAGGRWGSEGRCKGVVVSGDSSGKRQGRGCWRCGWAATLAATAASRGKQRRRGFNERSSVASVHDVSLFIHSIMAATTMLLQPPATHAVAPSSTTAIASIALPTIALPSAIAAKPSTPLLPLPGVTIFGLKPQLLITTSTSDPY